jgi:hypothetical protein
MHPEIVQDGPGSCPKCGMALVPIVAAAPGAAAEEDKSELRDMTRRFWASAVLSAPLVVLAMAPYFGFAEPFACAEGRSLLEFLLGTPVVLWGGWPFFQKFLALAYQSQPEHVHPHRPRRSRSPTSTASWQRSRPGLFPARAAACTGGEGGRRVFRGCGP